MNILGCSPTLIRALIPNGEPDADMSSLRTIVTTGEPWNSRPVPLAVRARRRRPLPDHQLLWRDGGRRMLPLADAGDPDQGGLARRACARHGDGRRRRRGALRARRGRRARLPQALPRDDARVLARPGALPRRLLAPAARDLGARGLGLGGRGRLLVPARPLRRHDEHRRQADRPGRARVGRGGASRCIGGGRGRRPSPRQGRGGVDLLRAGAGLRAVRRVVGGGLGGGRRGAREGVPARSRAVRPGPPQDAQRQDRAPCGARAGAGQRIPAISRRSRIPKRSTRSAESRPVPRAPPTSHPFGDYCPRLTGSTPANVKKSVIRNEDPA